MTFQKIDVRLVKKPKRMVKRVFIHCSASDRPEDDNAATIDRWHKERGWSGIGYHFFVRKDGTIESGRDLEVIPAAQKGHNTGSIAICVHGLKEKNFTLHQRSALTALCLHLNMLYERKITFHGHCEVEKNKTCPVFNYRLWLHLDSAGRIQV